MIYFEKKFTSFILNFLKVIISLITIVALGQSVYSIIVNYDIKVILNLVLFVIYIVISIGFYFALKRKVKMRGLLIYILLVGITLRILWSFSLDNIPVSDFDQAFKAAMKAANGNYVNMTGTYYFGRFPHYIIFILYMSKCILLFGDKALLVMKIINIIFSTSTIIFIYLILKEVFNDYRRVAIGTFLSAIMPASILYTPVYCTENLAIPFYLASIYIFLLVINNKKKYTFLLLAGVLLLLGHLFRMTAEIVLIAYIMYIIIYTKKDNFKKFKCVICIGCSFIIPLVLVGNLLVNLDITDRKIWDGSEPKITSVLKGSNMESYGRWNEEDAKFINKNLDSAEYLENGAKEKVIERYTTSGPLKLLEFFIVKITCQWKDGDCSGAFWTEYDLPSDDIKVDVCKYGNAFVQVFYSFLLVLSLIGLRNKESIKNKMINLFYLIFCGYGTMFLIIESQDRYAFIINWIFIIFATTSIKGKRLDENKKLLL